MHKFDAWLKGRDLKLSEALSAEKLAQHGFDAMSYAKAQVDEKERARKTAQMVENLGKIQSQLESWVSTASHNAEKLKAVASIIHSHATGGHADTIVATVAKNLPEVDSLEGLSKVFAHQNVMSALSDEHVLRDLAKLLDLDYIHDISTELPKRLEPHDHGEIGRHFADFAVSQMLHASTDVLNAIKGQGEEPKAEPKQSADSQTAPPMGRQEQQ